MSLQVWLPLNGDLRNQGCADITVNNTGATVDNNGKIGKCYSFSSKALYGDLPNLNNYTQISGCCWVYLTNLNSAQYFIHCGGQSSYPCKFSIDYEGGIRFQINGTEYNSGITLTINTWYHITVTWNGTEAKLYINGIEKNTKSASGTFSASNHFAIGARTNSAAGNAFAYYITSAGKINDVRIYDHCLSAAEVKEISQGLVLHYKLDNYKTKQETILSSEITNTAYNSSNSKYGYNETSNLAKTTGTFQGKASVKISTITAGQNAQPYVYFSNLYTSNGTNQPAYKTLNFDYYTTCPTTTWLNIYKLGSGSGTAAWTTYSRTIGARSGIYTNSESGHNLLVQPNEWNHIEVTFHGTTDANAEWGYCINGPTHTSNANYYFLYANIQLVASNSLMFEDSSGYNLNASTNGTFEKINSSGRFNKAVRLATSAPTTSDETDITYILSPLALTTPNQMTVAWWAKPESGYNSSTAHAAFCTSVNSRPTDYNTTAMHHRDSGFDLCPNSGSSIRLTFNQYTANQWHHYAITYDGQKAIAYKDGTKLTEASMSAAGPLKSFTGLWIGYSQAGGVKRKTLGSYSDFRVYVTALSAADILELYHTGAKIGNKGDIHTYELNEGFGLEENAKFINNSATSMTYDAATDTYTIVSPVGTSSWGYGVRLADTPALEVPYGMTYRWTAEVWTPVALNINTDYNNTATTTWAGNDNDATGTRLAAGNAIPANTWTRIYRGASNTNASNTNHLPIRDYSNLGLVTNGQSGPVTWKVRHLQWYLVDTTFQPQIKKTGVFEAEHFTEVEQNLNKPAQFNKQMFSVNGNEFIEL